jgi:hypothetical protein
VRRGAEHLLEGIGADDRAGAVHLVERPDAVGDGDEGVFAVEFLIGQLAAKQRQQFIARDGLQRAGVEHRVGLVRHDGLEVQPRLGELVFGQENLVGYGFHGGCSFRL